jgi:hypothetical protein
MPVLQFSDDDQREMVETSRRYAAEMDESINGPMRRLANQDALEQYTERQSRPAEDVLAARGSVIAILSHRHPKLMEYYAQLTPEAAARDLGGKYGVPFDPWKAAEFWQGILIALELERAG